MGLDVNKIGFHDDGRGGIETYYKSPGVPTFKELASHGPSDIIFEASEARSGDGDSKGTCYRNNGQCSFAFDVKVTAHI